MVEPRSIAELQAKYADKGLKWKIEAGLDGRGKLAFAIISADKESGRLLIVAAIEGGKVSKPHRHTKGELIMSRSGKLIVNCSNVPSAPKTHSPNDAPLWLPPGSEHQPEAEWWWGEYIVPAGLEILED